jgi:septal ring factor EnvC (AmiA/AmiB activator)
VKELGRSQAVKACAAWKAVSMIAVVMLGVAIGAQTPDRSRTEAVNKRVSDRIVALQREADRLAGEAKTLVGELRTLEVERDLQVERYTQAQADVAAARKAVEQITARVAELEQQRVQQLPEIKAQLVDIYKRGSSGYARLIFGVSSMRDLGRATRAVGALVRINEQRIEEHRRTLAATRQQGEALQARLRELQTAETAARQARAAADRAVNARNALIARIDERRDLNARFAGELQESLLAAMAEGAEQVKRERWRDQPWTTRVLTRACYEAARFITGVFAYGRAEEFT